MDGEEVAIFNTPMRSSTTVTNGRRGERVRIPKKDFMPIVNAQKKGKFSKVEKEIKNAKDATKLISDTKENVAKKMDDRSLKLAMCNVEEGNLKTEVVRCPLKDIHVNLIHTRETQTDFCESEEEDLKKELQTAKADAAQYRDMYNALRVNNVDVREELNGVKESVKEVLQLQRRPSNTFAEHEQSTMINVEDVMLDANKYFRGET